MRYFILVAAACFAAAAFTTPPPMEVTSRGFSENGSMPQKYTCAGENVNPPLTIRHIPLNTRTLALVVEHPNTPNGDVTEWVAWNIIPDGVISENTRPGIVGKNTWGERHYSGPCPQGLTGLHHYKFTVYAVDKTLCLKKGSDRAALESAMSGHVLATAELSGTFGSETNPPASQGVER